MSLLPPQPQTANAIEDGFIKVPASKKTLAKEETKDLTADNKVPATCMEDVFTVLESRRHEFSASTWWSIVKAQRKDSITFFYKLFEIANNKNSDFYNKDNKGFQGGSFESKAIAEALKEAKTTMTEKKVIGEVKAINHSKTDDVEAYAWIHVIRIKLDGVEVDLISDYPQGKAADDDGFQDKVTGHGSLTIATAGRMQLNKVTARP